MFAERKINYRVVIPMAMIFFVMMSGAIIGIRFLLTENETALAAAKSRNLIDLKDRITYLDEVLTMSARMTAATGDLTWETRYRYFEKELDSVIDKTSNSVPPSWMQNFLTTTSDANKKLVAMENLAFSFVHAHKPDSAQFILEGKEYAMQKNIYKAGVERLQSQIEIYVNDFVRSNEKEKQFIKLIYPGVALVLFITYFFMGLEIFRGGRMKRMLLDQKENFRVTLASLTEGVITTNMKGQVTFMNQMAESLTGWKSSEVLRQPLEKIFKTTNEQTGKPIENIVSRILMDNKPVLFENNTIIHSKDAQTYIISNNGSPLRDKNQNIVGAVLVFRDLTESSKARQELKESEKKYRTLFETMSDGIYKSSPEGKFMEVNPAMVKMFGYGSREEMMAIDIKSDLYFQEEDRTAAINQNNVNGLDVFRLRKKDGSEIWVEDSGKYVSDENGKVLYHEGVLRDVTDRNKIEKELADSEFRLRTILELEPECIKLLDAKGKILQMNPAGLEMFEAESEAAVLGRSPLEIIHQQYHEPYSKLSADVFNGKSGKLQFEVTGLKGTHRWLETHAVPMRNQAGEITSMLGVTRDITESKKHETELKNLATRLLLATSSAKIGIWDWDIENNLLIWDDNMYRIYGVTSEQFTGAYDAWSHALHPDDFENVTEAVQAAIAGTRDYHPVFRICLSDNQVRYVEGHAIILRDDEGKAVRMIGVNRDITEQKEAEQKLEEQNRELQKTNNELDSFVYSTSHDLRAPLSSILGIIGITEMETREDNTKKNLALIAQSVRRQDQFILEILDYSRNARGELKPVPVDFKEIIGNVRGNLKFMEGAENIRLKLSIDQTFPFYSDPHRLYVIINNLVTNAIKYSDTKKEQPFVSISVKTSAEHAEIVVEDNGIGIAREHKNKIFEMFFRASEQSYGTGLGLYILRETLNKLNGNISLESEAGKGSRFQLLIPNCKYDA